ncbi:MAG: S1C family serine protease [Caldimonas sp.]
MTEPLIQPPVQRLRWRRSALAFTISLLAGLGGETVARAETTADIAAPANAVLARLEGRKAALARANEAVVGVEVMAVEDARSILTLGRVREGSGVVIGADGLVLTIGYLILEADHVDLVDSGGRHIPARVVAYDLASGFGLLQALAPLSLAPAPLGSSAAVTGDEPLMIASGGDDGDLSLARMVSRRAFSGNWEYHIDGALFTAPARRDHSGAGLFNAEGELVGIGSLVVTDAAGGSAPKLRGNMFVPVDLLKPILAELRARGASHASTRPWLGLNCDESFGHIRIIRLTPAGPAEDAGLEPGDLIMAIDGTDVADLASFYKALWRDERAERDVALDVRRGADSLRLTVRAVDRMNTLSRPQGV